MFTTWRRKWVKTRWGCTICSCNCADIRRTKGDQCRMERYHVRGKRRSTRTINYVLVAPKLACNSLVWCFNQSLLSNDWSGRNRLLLDVIYILFVDHCCASFSRRGEYIERSGSATAIMNEGIEGALHLLVYISWDCNKLVIALLACWAPERNRSHALHHLVCIV